MKLHYGSTSQKKPFKGVWTGSKKKLKDFLSSGKDKDFQGLWGVRQKKPSPCFPMFGENGIALCNVKSLIIRELMTCHKR